MQHAVQDLTQHLGGSDAGAGQPCRRTGNDAACPYPGQRRAFVGKRHHIGIVRGIRACGGIGRRPGAIFDRRIGPCRSHERHFRAEDAGIRDFGALPHNRAAGCGCGIILGLAIPGRGFGVIEPGLPPGVAIACRGVITLHPRRNPDRAGRRVGQFHAPESGLRTGAAIVRNCRPDREKQHVPGVDLTADRGHDFAVDFALPFLPEQWKGGKLVIGHPRRGQHGNLYIAAAPGTCAQFHKAGRAVIGQNAPVEFHAFVPAKRKVRDQFLAVSVAICGGDAHFRIAGLIGKSSDFIVQPIGQERRVIFWPRQRAQTKVHDQRHRGQGVGRIRDRMPGARNDPAQCLNNQMIRPAPGGVFNGP